MKIKYGLTGNYYIISPHKSQVQSICQYIGKSINSVYYNKKHQVWVARIKSKKHKNLLRERFAITKISN